MSSSARFGPMPVRLATRVTVRATRAAAHPAAPASARATFDRLAVVAAEQNAEIDKLLLLHLEAGEHFFEIDLENRHLFRLGR